MEKPEQELEELTQEAIAVISTIAATVSITTTIVIVTTSAFSVEFHVLFIVSHCRYTLCAVVEIIEDSRNIEAVCIASWIVGAWSGSG